MIKPFLCKSCLNEIFYSYLYTVSMHTHRALHIAHIDTPTHVHYRSKVWGHLNVLVFERKAHLSILKEHQIDQKYSVDIVNAVHDYCSWKRQMFHGISI